MRLLRISVCAAPLLAPGAAAHAQESQAPPSTPDHSDVTLSLRGGVSHTFRADLDDDGGDVSITRAAAGIGVDWNAAEKLRLSFAFDNEFSWYDFAGTAAALDDIIDEGLEHELSIRAAWILDGGNSITALGSVGAGYEPGADISDSLTYSAGAAYGFKVNDNLSLNLGIAVRSRLEDDVLVVPILGVNWRINESTTLSSEGLGARLTVAVRDNLDVYLRAGAEIHEFRLDDDNPALPEGVLSDTRVPVALGFNWEPADNLRLSLEGGAVVWQEYELRDDDDTISDTNTDPAAFIGIRISWSF